MSAPAPVLVLVESNTSGTGRLFPVAARELGLRPVLLTAGPGRYPFAGEVDVIRTGTASVRDIAAACRRLAAEAPIAGVTTSSEYYIEAAGLVAGDLGLPANPPDAIRATRDKGIQRLVLAAGGVRVPGFAVASTTAEAVAATAGLGFPVVVKPVSGSGSSGVLLCADAAQVGRQAGALLARTVNERNQPIPRRVLVERFVPGTEYSVEVFDGAAVGVTRKHLGPLPRFVEIGHDFPAALDGPERAGVVRMALAAVGRLGLSLGPAHVEVRVQDGEPVLIEVNPRLAGGWIPRLVLEATGVDLIRETVRVFSGGQAVLEATDRRGAAIRFVLTPGTGTLACLHGLDDARRVPGVVQVEAYREPGAGVVGRGDFRDRIGHVLATARTAAAAGTAAEEGLRRIRPTLRTAEESLA